LSQRRTKARPIRPENLEARAIAAAIKTPADLLAMLESLPDDKQRAAACNLMKPYLPQFISKRGTRLVIRIEEKEPRPEANANPTDR
jgi:hypothetical protein